MTAPVYYDLDADPAANPNQGDPSLQDMNHPGARMHTERLMRAGAVQLQAQVKLGDVYLDYSTANPSNAALLSVPGLVGVCRYLSPWNPSTGEYYGPTAAKMITAPELANLLDILADEQHNYEWYEGRVSEGAPAGTQDAFWAGTLAYMLDTAVRRPTQGRSILFSDDTGATPYEAVVAYLLAAKAQLDSLPGGYLPGYYGRQNIIALLATDARINWPILLWQTCAWSGGVYGGTGHLYQAICAPTSPTLPGCDTNFVMKPFPTGDDDMSAEDVAAINAHTDTKIAEVITKMWWGDSKFAAMGQVDPATGKVPPQGHPNNLWQVYRATSGIKDVTDTLNVATLKQTVTDAVTAGLAGGLDPAVVTAAIEKAFAAANIGLDVTLSGKATTPSP